MLLAGIAIFYAPFLEEIQRIVVIAVLAFPAVYVIARFSLVLPSIAVDSMIPFRESWNLTRGKPVFVLLVLIPVFLSWVAAAFSELFGGLESIVTSVTSCLILVYEIAILSNLYAYVQDHGGTS